MLLWLKSRGRLKNYSTSYRQGNPSLKSERLQKLQALFLSNRFFQLSCQFPKLRRVTHFIVAWTG